MCMQENNATSSEYQAAVLLTIDCLRSSQRGVGEARTFIGLAIGKRALSVDEQKLLQKARIDLSEAYDKLRVVLDALKIAVK